MNNVYDLDAEKVKSFLGIKWFEDDIQIQSLILPTIKFIEKETGLTLNNEDGSFNIDDGLAFITAKFIEFFMNKTGVKGYTLSRESTTFSDEIPAFLLSMLNPYKKDDAVQSDKAVKFYPLW